MDAANSKRTFSGNSSGISSLPSVSDHCFSPSHVPQLPSHPPPIQQSPQNIYYPANSIQMGTQSPFDSELYDNDPINLTDLDYSRYLNSLSNKSSGKKNPHEKTYSTGVYMTKAPSSAKKIVTPTSILSATSSISGSTPTLSQNSYVGGSSLNSTLTIESMPLSSSLSFASSPKVKFNDFQIHHHYEQYESPSPPQSPLTPVAHAKTYDSAVKMQPQYLLTPQYLEESASTNTFSTSSSSSTSQAENPSTLTPDFKNQRVKGKYFNKEYVSTCNVPLYSTAKPQKYVNVVKAVKPAIKNNNNSNSNNTNNTPSESVEVFSI